MYDRIYNILEEKGRVKTAIFLDGPDMGKKCVLSEGKPDEEERKMAGEIWKPYLELIENTKETKVVQTEGKRIFIENYRKNPKMVIFGGGHVSQPTAHLDKRALP